MNTSIRHHPSRRQRPWARALTRGPRVIGSPTARAAVTTLILAGAALTVISGVIHLYLWGEPNGYRQLTTIGPLFLVQGISAIVTGVATAVTRRLVAVLAAAGLLATTAVGLAITIEHGLFGFQEAWGAPYARTSLYEEIAGVVLLLIAALALARRHGTHPTAPLNHRYLLTPRRRRYHRAAGAGAGSLIQPPPERT